MPKAKIQLTDEQKKISMKSVERAVKLAGTISQLAIHLGTERAVIHRWKNGERPISVAKSMAIDSWSKGLVSKHDLRPDVWPGRPLRRNLNMLFYPALIVQNEDRFKITLRDFPDFWVERKTITDVIKAAKDYLIIYIIDNEWVPSPSPPLPDEILIDAHRKKKEDFTNLSNYKIGMTDIKNIL